MKIDEKQGVYGSLILVQVFFGLNYLAAKVALADFEPQALAVLRVAGGAVALLFIARATGRRWPLDRGTLIRLAILSVIGVGANQVLFIEGLSRTTSTHSSLINTTIPVATLLFAMFAGRERATPRKLAAFAIATAGVVLVIRPWTGPGLEGAVLGDLLTLANALSFSLFLAASKPLLSRIDPLAATALLMTFGAIAIGIVGLPEVLATDFAAVSGFSWLMLGYIILFPTAGAYWLQYRALSRVDSSVVAIFIYLQPVIATGLSVALLGDRPSALVLAGGALIFLGVWVAVRRRPPAPRPI